MDTKTKNTILVIAVIFLTVLNIATVGSIFYHIKRMQQKQKIEVQRPGQFHFPPAPRPYPRQGPPRPQPKQSDEQARHARHFRHIMDELNLSPEQRKYFIDRRKEFLRIHRPLMDSLRYYHRLLDSLACSQNPDINRIKTYSRQIADLHYRFTLDYTLLLNDWYKHCNREQKKKFCQIFDHSNHSRRTR